MRADAPVLVAGVASFPRVEAEKDPELYFFVCSDTEVNAKALHYGHKAKKNFIAASKAFQDDYHAQVAIHCGMARLGPKKQRLTRAEWKAQKEHAMKSRSSGECGARFRCDQGEGGA